MKNYKAFEGINLSDKREKNESYEDYKNRLKKNKKIMKLYRRLGRDVIYQAFPTGIKEGMNKIEENLKSKE